MRSFLLLILAAALPAHAQDQVIDPCVIDAAIACPVEIILPDIGLVDGDPVLTGPDRLTFVVRDRDEPEQASAVDVSLIDGRILRKLPLGTAREDTLMFDWLVAPNAQGFLAFVWENKRDRILVFYDAKGMPRSKMPEIRPQGWPYELTMARALMLLGQQGVLTFDGEALHGQLGRFDVKVAAADARMTVVERTGAEGGGQTFEDYVLERLTTQIAEVGTEFVHVEGNVSAVTTFRARKSPARFFLRTAEGQEIDVDTQPEPPPSGIRVFHYARLSPDGRFVAVIKSEEDRKPTSRLLVIDTNSKEVLFEAPVRPCWASGLRWLPDGRIARLCFRMRDGIEVIVFDPRLPR
ncbi:MAG: hypothetical protein EOP21_02655 [Hyphomicrobiales bacterium]|nr:MAG: hypothetical protein EOP21_02655 [Hyphomicrobiales bacterium]